MDQLSDEERLLAWEATWHPSFSGTAIVNEDFTFRSVNPQFSKLLGVTPADLIGKKFQDITPVNIRELDQKNAQLLIDGVIPFYVLPKKYEFTNGETTSVILLVTRAPLEGDFQFFVSRIMLDATHSLSNATPLNATNKVAEYVLTNKSFLTALTVLLTAILTALATFLQ